MRDESGKTEMENLQDSRPHPRHDRNYHVEVTRKIDPDADEINLISSSNEGEKTNDREKSFQNSLGRRKRTELSGICRVNKGPNETQKSRHAPSARGGRDLLSSGHGAAGGTRTIGNSGGNIRRGSSRHTAAGIGTGREKTNGKGLWGGRNWGCQQLLSSGGRKFQKSAKMGYRKLPERKNVGPREGGRGMGGGVQGLAKEKIEQKQAPDHRGRADEGKKKRIKSLVNERKGEHNWECRGGERTG